MSNPDISMLRASSRREGHRSLQRVTDRWHRHRKLFEGRRLIGLLLILASALALYQATASAERQTARYHDQRVVYVATADLPAGHPIAINDVVQQSWPSHLVPPSALGSDPTGQVLIQTIARGEPVTSGRLGDGPFGLRDDELAIALPVPLAPPPVEKGHRVLLIGLRAPDGPFQQSSSALTDARVLVVSDLAITVAVPKATALQTIEAMAFGSIEIVITPG